ncbi:UNVERIFIED_CONTAM: hypothetical protein GTU68_029452 [Idotea baltica]|nr:hypothetical protein [Idotea baltica]
MAILVFQIVKTLFLFDNNTNVPINILGIESSCDDTSASICQDGKILSNIINSQKIHEEYGGVVPELASRAHQQNIVPVVSLALQKAGIQVSDLSAVAFTGGPGLIGPLLVGVSFGKSLAQSLQIPVINVHHMKAHILAHFIDDPMPQFPFVCLTVSGGHTQIVLVTDYLEMEVIGQTIDDAAGEAFDKTAKMLGLKYPGGPLLDKLAQDGDPLKFKFAKPRIEGLNFSFSGLKTSVLYFLQKQEKLNSEFIQENLNDLCASIQHTIVAILIEKLEKASAQTGITEIAIAGGVSANSGLRKALSEQEEKCNWKTYTPQLQYCTDNAGMVAQTAYYQFLAKDFAKLTYAPKARIKI